MSWFASCVFVGLLFINRTVHIQSAQLTFGLEVCARHLHVEAPVCRPASTFDTDRPCDLSRPPGMAGQLMRSLGQAHAAYAFRPAAARQCAFHRLADSRSRRLPSTNFVALDLPLRWLQSAAFSYAIQKSIVCADTQGPSKLTWRCPASLCRFVVLASQSTGAATTEAASQVVCTPTPVWKMVHCSNICTCLQQLGLHTERLACCIVYHFAM